MFRLSFWLFVAVVSISQSAQASPVGHGEDSLHFSGRREFDDAEFRTHRRRPQGNEGGSYIENVFKIPIAVIKGTSAAAQAFSPQNTETINKIFDIPVMTLDAVGNFIKETRPQRPSNDEVNDEVNEQRPARPGFENRDQRRERIMRIREEERMRRRLIEQERQRRRIKDQQQKFFNLGNHPALNFASNLMDLLLDGGHGHGSGLFGSHHGHGHGFHGSHGKPPHRPLKPQKPLKPSNQGSYGGSHGNQQTGGNEGYEVHEQVDEDRIGSSGIFSWLQPTSQSNDDRIQNKIAPGSEYRNNREHAEFRFP